MISPSIDSALCAGIESSLNALLKHDPGLLHALEKFDNKRIRIQSEDWLILAVTIQPTGLSLSLQDEDACDATIYGRLDQLIAVALADDKADALMNGELDISGSSSLVLDLAKIVQQIDIDWEALISPMTGGIIAHQLGKGFRNLMQWGKESRQTLTVSGKEYLEDEIKLLTPKPLAEHFSQQVADLRLSTDRAEARLNHLKQQIEQQGS